MGSLTIVVVTHQSAAVVGHCLAALGPRLQPRVLVVDNASRDGTADVLGEARVPVIANPTNEGYARAANTGARAADGRYLCFLNPDCEATPEVMAAGAAALAGDVRRCAAPRLVEADGHVVEGRQPGYTRVKLLDDVLRTNYGDNPLSHWLHARPGYHDRRWWWGHGACLFVARDWFLELGGFDERYFVYMEDVDFGHRLSARGGMVVSLPAHVRHRGREGARVDGGRRRRLLNAARLRYARLHHGPAWAAGLALLAAPGQLRAMLLSCRS